MVKPPDAQTTAQTKVLEEALAVLSSNNLLIKKKR